MKHYINQIVILSLCLLCGTAYGQTGTLYNVPMQGIENIVRYEPTTGKHVTYSLVAGNENHFSLTDMNTLRDVKVATGLKITDFEIIDGVVFFCGKNGSGSGFLGWFDIDSLFFLGGSAHIDQTLSALGLLTLDNIEVYHDTTGDIHIAGYGVRSFSMANVTLSSAFEAVGTPTTGMQYRTLELWSIGQFGEIIDMAVTDNLVVYMCSERTQASPLGIGIGITFQPFPKYDMFGTPPFYYHFFQLSSMAMIPGWILPANDDPCNGTNPKMVHSVRDEIAVCTYRKDFDAGIGFAAYGNPSIYSDTYITHQMFDLSGLVPNTNNYIQMTSNNIAKLYNGATISIDGFVYEPQTQKYVILHRHESSAGVVEHAITTVDYTGGVPTFFNSYYQTVFNTSSVWLPKSMCIDGSVYYTVMGYNMASSNYMFWHNSVASISGACDNIIQYNVTPMSPVPAKYYENAAMPTTWYPLQFIKQVPWDVQELPCEILCN